MGNLFSSHAQCFILSENGKCKFSVIKWHQNQTIISWHSKWRINLFLSALPASNIYVYKPNHTTLIMSYHSQNTAQIFFFWSKKTTALKSDLNIKKVVIAMHSCPIIDVYMARKLNTILKWREFFFLFAIYK